MTAAHTWSVFGTSRRHQTMKQMSEITAKILVAGTKLLAGVFCPEYFGRIM